MLLRVQGGLPVSISVQTGLYLAIALVHRRGTDLSSFSCASEPCCCPHGGSCAQQLRFPATLTCSGSSRPKEPSRRAEFSAQTGGRLVVKQGYDKRNRTLAHNRRRFFRTWAAGSAGVIKDISCGLSLALGRRLQRPAISPFLISQPRQLPQKHLSRALQTPFRVLHR